MPGTPALLSLDPIPALLGRVRSELSGEFSPAGRRPLRLSRAPGRLDVMGGIADYTGSLVCEMTLDRAAAVALAERDDRELQVFSLNLYDEHQPFTFRIPLQALADHPIDLLRREFEAPGRKWAGYFAGCLALLHESRYIDLRDPAVRGLNLAVYSTVAPGAGVSSSAAIEVATMMNLVDHFRIRRQADDGANQTGARLPTDHAGPSGPGSAPRNANSTPPLNPLDLATLCQSVENRIVGAPCGIMDQVTSCLGEAGSLLRMVCQPHDLQPPLRLPQGMRVVGINSNVRHSVGAGQYGRVRCAAFMGHKIILEQMRRVGAAVGRTLVADPMNGYLANLDPDDYKRLFRPHLPPLLKGGEFLLKYGPTIDKATTVEPDYVYAVVNATDHHVLEARRVRQFVSFLERAAAAPAKPAESAGSAQSRDRGGMLDRAGHLMYASHFSYTNDALLGCDECDLLVQLVRERERAGLYGARITGGGSGGTVAVLADEGPRADAAIAEILAEYERQTARKPEAFTGSSPGAWHAGTAVVENDE